MRESQLQAQPLFAPGGELAPAGEHAPGDGAAAGNPGPRRSRLPVKGRRQRRLTAMLAAAGLVGAGLMLVHHEVLPRYRPSLRAGETFGIDVSNHQGAINWGRAAGAGKVSFAYLKATEGNDFVDKRFAQNWAGARQAGNDRGAYHFFTLCSSGAEQARNFLSVLPNDPGSLPPAVDLEFSDCARRPSSASVRKELGTFLTTVENAIHRPLLVYSLPAFGKVYPVKAFIARDQWQRKLFRRPIASNWAIWQVSDRARVAGVDGPVDLDVSGHQWLADNRGR